MSTKNTFKHEFKKRCYRYSLSIIHVEKQLGTGRATRIIFDQLLRSGMSIGTNVVEGSNSSSRREFINFFQIALKSASETLYWLSLLSEMDKEAGKTITVLIQEGSEIKKLLTTIILNTKDHSKF